jgi:ribosomal protein S18 acetylase RimI-like enzyme
VEIDLLGPGEWWDLKSARLAALQDSSDAFVADLADEKRRTRDEWIASINRSTWAVARHVRKIVGIARLTATDSNGPAQEHFIESVWVGPRYRQNGVVRRMLHRLEKQARNDGVELLQLWVLETNDSAYDAYLKLDFHPVSDRVQDSSKPRGDGTFVQERLMVKPLF